MVYTQLVLKCGRMLKSPGEVLKLLILGPMAKDSDFIGTGHCPGTGDFSKLPRVILKYRQD